jgi:hypothetical protein
VDHGEAGVEELFVDQELLLLVTGEAVPVDDDRPSPGARFAVGAWGMTRSGLSRYSGDW